MERLAKKYAGVDFVLVYCHEAHPEKEETGTIARPVLRAHDYTERRRVALWMREQSHIRRRILPDEFGEASVFDRYFSARLDNPLVVVDIEGKLACAMSWTAAEQVDLVLARLLAHGGKWDPP